MTDHFSLSELIEYETHLLKKLVTLKELYKYKSCLVKFGTDLKPQREYTIREFVWGFIKDPSLANQVASKLETVLPDIRDQQPTMTVPEMVVKQPICGIRYSNSERYFEIKSKLTNKNTFIIFQTENSFYAMYHEDALVSRDLFHMEYNEEEETVYITEEELPDMVRIFATEGYDLVVFSSNEEGDARADHITSLIGQRLVGFQ